jgi:hypothetical protein
VQLIGEESITHWASTSVLGWDPTVEHIAATSMIVHDKKTSTMSNKGAKCYKHTEHGKGSHKSVDPRLRKYRKKKNFQRKQAKKAIEEAKWTAQQKNGI